MFASFVCCLLMATLGPQISGRRKVLPQVDSRGGDGTLSDSSLFEVSEHSHEEAGLQHSHEEDDAEQKELQQLQAATDGEQRGLQQFGEELDAHDDADDDEQFGEELGAHGEGVDDEKSLIERSG